MPEDRGNCVPNALLAQLSHLPPKVRAVHVRAGMVMFLIQNEDTVLVRAILMIFSGKGSLIK